MKTNFLVFICVIISLQSYSQSQIQDKQFSQFANLYINIEKYPFNYKRDTPSPIYTNAQPHKIMLDVAKKYLGFSDWDWHAIDYNYNSDDNILTTSIVDNPPLAHLKLFYGNFIGLVYRNGRGIENDTLKVVLNVFTLEGKIIDSMIIGGHTTRENDWTDVVFLTKDTFKIFNYSPNIENYNIKDGIYHIINEKAPRTVVEIKDYQIDDGGKIKHIKTHSKQYLKESVSFYRNYHKESDDPMNEY
jgi:hypothetical protein